MNDSPRRNVSGTRPTIVFLTAQIIDTNGMDLWHGVADAARQHEVNLICLVGDEVQVSIGFRAQANVLYEFVSAERIDGLVIWGSTFSNYAGMTALAQFCERHRSLPMVTISTPLPGVPCVFVDNYQAMHNAMVHLITIHQHTRIAFIRGPESSPESNERYRAYTDVLRDYGLPFDPALVESADYWNAPFGAKAIEALLARPGMTPQAVVAACDAVAIDAMSALQARGLRVPGDVAVIGFDNANESRYTTPPLTSVPIPYYAQGYRAVEMLLDVLAGVRVPEQVVLSEDLVVRQSCGCVNPIVKQAAIGPVKATGESLHTAVAAIEKPFLSDLAQTITSSPTEHVHTWGTRLLDAFVIEMQDIAGGAFASTLDEVLCQVNANDGNIGEWQGAIAILRRHTLPYFGTMHELVKADDLWQQAQVTIGQMMQRAQAYQTLLTEQAAQTLRELEAALITTFDLNGLIRVLMEGLPRLGFAGCALALYDDPQRLTGDVLCLLAYNEQGELDVQSNDRHFPARQLVPRGFLSREKPSHLVVEPLYFQDHQLGVIVFQQGPRDGTMYEILRGQISSALQGALLVQRVQEHSAEIVRRNAEIARQKYILDTFIETVPDRIWFKDREGRFTRANRAHARGLGLEDPREEIGKTDADFYSPNVSQVQVTDEQEILRSGRPMLNKEVSTTGPDGGQRWLLVTKMPLLDEHQNIIGTFGISRDITALKQTQAALERAYAEVEHRVEERTAELQREIAQRIRAEDALRTLNAELEHRVKERTATLEALNEELRNFAYVVSHDLKAPLRGIAHLAQWLAEDYGEAFDEQGRKMVALLVGRVKRMDDLIEGILEYSRIGRTDTGEAPVDLRQLVSAVIDSLAVPNHIQIRVASALPIVRCNMTRMTQVFQNLIGNAVKFLDKPRGTIAICCEDRGDTWLFRITDNGLGIEERYYQRIFKIFQTLTSRYRLESTGIGLALVKKIVELYGGKVWVESTVGEGSTFLFTLPKA